MNVLKRSKEQRRPFLFPRWGSLAIALAGIALMIFGIWRGEMNTVLQKASNICLECIGIG